MDHLQVPGEFCPKTTLSEPLLLGVFVHDSKQGVTAPCGNNSRPRTTNSFTLLSQTSTPNRKRRCCKFPHAKLSHIFQNGVKFLHKIIPLFFPSIVHNFSCHLLSPGHLFTGIHFRKVWISPGAQSPKVPTNPWGTILKVPTLPGVSP